MLDYITGNPFTANPQFKFYKLYHRIDSRLIRLISIAYCYQIWGLFSQPRVRYVILESESYCDNPSLKKRIKKFHDETPPIPYEPMIAYYCTSENNKEIAFALSSLVYFAHHKGIKVSEAWKNVYDIIAKVEGNWENNWKTSDVTSLAKTIYDNKSYSLMPILADALQEAGCDDEGILNYCRGTGPFFRGCWVLDKGTGKR